MSEKPRQKCSYPGVTVKILLYFLIFITMMLAVLWVFQIMLLNFFYRTTKTNEMQDIAEIIEQSLQQDDDVLEELVYRHAAEHGVCIRVFRIEPSNRAVEIANADVSEGCYLHHVNGATLSELYNKSVASSGNYTTVIPLTGGKNEISDSNGPHTPLHPSGEAKRMSMVRVDVCRQGDVPYVIMLNSELTPLSATVATLKTQYFWIALVFVLLALLLAITFSRSIISPIVRMNQSAKQLAQGNYDVRFEGEGYRETRELADTLNYASKELSKNDRLQKELIANISHDLRTPLTMIKGYGEVMRDIPGENTPENMQMIIDETERLSELVSALLDISRLQADAGEPAKAVFDLTAMVQNTVERYAKLRESDGYSVRFEFDVPQVYVNADKTMMLQVLYNLINNGINYAGEDKTVTVRQTCADGKVRISVIDHGVGIAADQIPLIWDRYYKVDRVHKRAVVGTGLGLSIVKTVLERHGALYGVDSREGQGSTFWFELPIE